MKTNSLLNLLGRCRDALVDANHSENDGGKLLRSIDRALNTKVTTPRVLVVMDGGLVQHVLSDVEIHAHTVDYDTDGADPGDTVAVPQDGDDTTDAYLGSPGSEVAPDRISEILASKPTVPVA